MKRILVLLSAVLLWAGVQGAAAQTRTITGRVTSVEAGQPLSGATVLIKGTTRGTQTDAEGRYSLEVPAGASTLTFSALGYGSQDVAIAGNVVNASLSQAVVALQGLVVTALGQTREKSRLGTAQQQLSSEELNTTRTHNLVSQLEGKVSGVNITSAGTPGGSVNINIRGTNSITGNNQPLFVVDGTPVSNSNRGGGLVSGYDFGNAISDLNPSDIETITVLKGPNAAALYGSRAANGVILITTKRGRAGGIQTEASVSYDWARPSILPDFQNRYGQGSGGEFAYVNGAGAGVFDYADQSFGPKLDGRTSGCVFVEDTETYDTSQPCLQYNGSGLPWAPHPNNVRDFFETGNTAMAHVAVSGGTERATGRLSLGVENTDGYVPNNSFRNVSALLSAGLEISDRLHTNGSIEYVRAKGLNRPGSGYLGSPLEQFFWFGRQVNIDDLRNYERGGATNNGPESREYNWNYNYHNNPFWLQYENPVEDTRDRLTLSGSAQYDLTDWANVQLRSGTDLYRLSIDENFAQGNLNFADPSYNGGFTFIDDYNNDNNTGLTINANRDLSDRINVDAMLGAGARREYYSTSQQATSGLSVAGIYNVSNAAITPSLFQFVRRRAVNSAYGSLAVTWDGWWTVEGTGRNDWSSTLPEGANSYFYPSINTSIVLTDAVPSLQGGFLSFAKLRGSIARVGNDADPYQLLTTYSGISTQFGGLPQFSLGNSLANANLKPEITTSDEVGVELGLFNNRATVDATYYSKKTKNQIFNVPVSPTSGFATQAVNAGAVTNKGWEALVSVTPVETASGFRWNSTINWAKNRSQVVDLFPGTTRLLLTDVAGRGGGIFGDIQLRAQIDKPYGAFYGYRFARDENGNLLTSGGYPLAEDSLSYLGTVQPDWTGGWMNEFSYGPVQLNVLFDARHGGKLFSYTNAVGQTSGVLESTLRGREEDWNSPGIVVDGVDVDTGAPNTVNLTSEDYFTSLLTNVAEPFVYDASYVKLRELRLGFEVPTRWTDRLGVESLNVALAGRNLYTWKKVPNIDPEFAYASNNYQGIEYAQVSNARTIGLTFQVRP